MKGNNIILKSTQSSRTMVSQANSRFRARRGLMTTRGPRIPPNWAVLCGLPTATGVGLLFAAHPPPGARRADARRRGGV